MIAVPTRQPTSLIGGDSEHKNEKRKRKERLRVGSLFLYYSKL